MKTKMCSFHRSGHCVVGEACRFAHTVEELKQAMEVQKDQPPLPSMAAKKNRELWELRRTAFGFGTSLPAQAAPPGLSGRPRSRLTQLTQPPSLAVLKPAARRSAPREKVTSTSSAVNSSSRVLLEVNDDIEESDTLNQEVQDEDKDKLVGASAEMQKVVLNIKCESSIEDLFSNPTALSIKPKLQGAVSPSRCSTEDSTPRSALGESIEVRSGLTVFQ